MNSDNLNSDGSGYLALATANNRFNSRQIKPKHFKWVSKVLLVILLAVSVTIFAFARGVPEVLADNPNATQYLTNTSSGVLTAVTAWQLTDAQDTDASSISIDIDRNESAGDVLQFEPGLDNTTPLTTKCGASPSGRGFILDTAFGSGTITQGAWTFYIEEWDNGPNRQGHIDVCVYRTTVSAGAIGNATLLFESQGDGTWSTTDTMNNAADSLTQTTDSQCAGGCSIGPNEYLYVEYWYDNETKVNENEVDCLIYPRTAGGSNSYITTPGMQIPENLVLLLAAAPLIPAVVLWMRRRRNIIY